MALGMFFLILFGVALLQTVLVQGQIHLDGLRANLAERQTEAQLLHQEVAVLESPEHVWDVAINDLGMVESDPRYILPPAEATPTAP